MEGKPIVLTKTEIELIRLALSPYLGMFKLDKRLERVLPGLMQKLGER